MPGLDIITDSILDKAKLDAENVLKQAEKKREELLGEATKEAESLVSQIEKESEENRKNSELAAKSKASQMLLREVLSKKAEFIKEVMKEAEKRVYAMNDDEYNKLLVSLLDKYAVSGKGGKIVFSNSDRKRISADTLEKIRDLGIELSENDANIKGGFILKYGNVDENCSIEAIFRDRQEEITDLLNSKLFS